MNMKPKQLKRLQRQEGLLHEFDGQEHEEHYEEKHIGDKWYVKSWNGGTKRWQVSVYSEDSFKRYKSWTDRNTEFEYAINKE